MSLYLLVLMDLVVPSISSQIYWGRGGGGPGTNSLTSPGASVCTPSGEGLVTKHTLKGQMQLVDSFKW